VVTLQDFVRQTILDVLKGVEEAQSDPDVGKRVAPIIPEHAKIDPSLRGGLARQGYVVSNEVRCRHYCGENKRGRRQREGERKGQYPSRSV
jgi:hypothetical protein